MKQQISHLVGNSLSLVSLTLLFLFLIPLVSSTAQFNPIPTQNLEVNVYSDINLDYYCFSDNPLLICEYSSYGLQFRNPDNNLLITFLGSGEHTNSYFIITLTPYGLIQILSKDKEISQEIIVFGADIPYSSQVSTSFTLNIQENLKPLQIASFLPPILDGNESITYYMNDFFLYHTSITVRYNDDLLNQTISLTRGILEGQICSTGQIRVCLDGISDDIAVSIQGQDLNYNSTVTDGNLFYITAINSYGSVSGTPFPIIVTPTGDYSAAPYRRPLSIAPLFIEYNSSPNLDIPLYNTYAISYHDFSYFYGNYTWLAATFTLHSTITNYNYNITFEFINNGTIYFNRSDGPSGTDSYPPTIWAKNVSGNPSLIDIGFNYQTGDGNSFYMSSFTFLFNITVYTKACNSNGCINTDGFGNLDRYLVRVIALPPEAVPITIAPITLGFHETKSININNFYSNFNYIIATWSEGSENFSLQTPSSGYNSTVYISVTPFYQARLYFNNILAVTSANNNHQFLVNLEACNSIGCVEGTDFIPLTVLFIIQDTALGQISDIQSSDMWWRGLFNLFLGFFPDSEGLTSNQKGTIVMITIGVTVLLTMFFGFKSGGSILPLIYVCAGLSFFLFIFFIARGYVSPVILVGIVIVSVGTIFLKYKGGGG